MLKTVIFFLLVLSLGIHSLDIESNVEDISKSEKNTEWNEQAPSNNPPRVIESFKTEPDSLDIEAEEHKVQATNNAPDIRLSNSELNPLDTESNVEDTTKFEKATEAQNGQKENNSHGDIESLNNEPNLNADSEPPQTGTKKAAASGLQLTEDQINQLADKILKAHGVKPDDESLQNYKSVERLKKVVQRLETNIENKLKETVAQALADNLEASNEEEEINNENVKTELPKDEETFEDIGYRVIYKDPGLEAEEMDIQNQEAEVQNDNTKVPPEEDVEDDTIEENAAEEQGNILRQQKGTEDLVEAVQQNINQETQNTDDRVEATHVKENDVKEKGTVVANKETETKGENEKTADFESTNQNSENEERNEAEDLVEKNVEEEEEEEEEEEVEEEEEGDAKRYEEQKEIIRENVAQVGENDDAEKRDIKITGVTADEVKLTESENPTEDDVPNYEKLSESIKEDDIQVLQEDASDAAARDNKIPDVTIEEEAKNNEKVQDVPSTNAEDETNTEAEKADTEEYEKPNKIIKENDETEINEDKKNLENGLSTNPENDIDTDSKDTSKLKDTEIEEDDNDQYEEQEETAKDDDEAEIDEDDEDEEYKEIQQNKLEAISEICKLEEGNCDQNEKERLYAEESNVNINFDEQSERSSETASESGYLDRIVKFLFDRF